MERRLRFGAIRMNSKYTGDPLEVIGAIHAAKRMKLDLIIAPEWALNRKYPNDGDSVREPYSPAEARQLIHALARATLGSRLIAMPGTMMVATPTQRTGNSSPFQSRTSTALYNVLPIVSKGRLVYSITKESDFGSSSFDLRREMLLSYSPKSRVLERGGIVYGIEICGDTGSLYRDVQYDSTKRVDVQVLVSCAKPTPVCAIRPGGIMLAADGAFSSSTLYTIDENGKLKGHEPDRIKGMLAVYSAMLKTNV
jgi:hypothetical protein